MPVRRFTVLLEYDPEAQLWVTFVPALDYISTYGETREEALDQTREMISKLPRRKGFRCRPSHR